MRACGINTARARRHLMDVGVDVDARDPGGPFVSRAEDAPDVNVYIHLLAIFRNGAGIWRSAPGRIPGIAPCRPVESLHELDPELLGDANQPGTRGPDEDPAQWIGARVGEA